MTNSYEYWIRFHGQKLGLVWQTDDGTGEDDGDTDRVLVDNGRIVCARTPTELETMAHRHGLILEEGNDDGQNLDELERLLELPASDETCAQLLNGWNLFNDIARSVGGSLDDRGPEASACYDKLFAGNNLETMTPPGEPYRPDFSHSDRLLITEILNRGRTILAAHI